MVIASGTCTWRHDVRLAASLLTASSSGLSKPHLSQFVTEATTLQQRSCRITALGSSGPTTLLDLIWFSPSICVGLLWSKGCIVTSRHRLRVVGVFASHTLFMAQVRVHQRL